MTMGAVSGNSSEPTSPQPALSKRRATMSRASSSAGRVAAGYPTSETDRIATRSASSVVRRGISAADALGHALPFCVQELHVPSSVSHALSGAPSSCRREFRAGGLYRIRRAKSTIS